MVYEYQCEKCGRFDIKQSIHDDALVTCPQCDNPIRMVFHPPEIRWTGDSKWRHRKGTVIIPEKDW